MPVDQTQRDEKHNLIVVTLVESYLSRFILENPRFYRDIYFKLFDGILHYLEDRPEQHQEFQAFFQDKPAGFDLSRYMYTVFSRVDSTYPGHDSFETLKSNFNLQPSDYFIKLMADELLNKTSKSSHKAVVSSPHKTIVDRFRSSSTFTTGFFSPVLPSPRSPFNPFRCPQLFDESNRGVISIPECSDDENEILSTRDIGIQVLWANPFMLVLNSHTV